MGTKPMEDHPPGQSDSPSDASTTEGRAPPSIPEQRDHSSSKESSAGLITPAGTDEEAWNEFFRRYKTRIERAERNQDNGLKKLSRRKTVIFNLYLTMVILALASAALTAVLASLYVINHGSMFTNIASGGGGFVVTGGMTLVLGSMRRQIRDEERELKKEGDDLRNIEAAMFAARVAPDPLKRCELLAELVRALNALLAGQQKR
jgi:hypothetical protein